MISRPRNAELRTTLRLCLLVMPALLACSDSPSGPEDTRGAMSISVVATGLDFPATFRVQLNTNFIGRDIKPNDGIFINSLLIGTYTVALTQLPSNCTASENPRTVIVDKSDFVLVRFNVICVAMFGALRVSVSTSGDDFDPTGYRLQLSSGVAFFATANSNTVFDKIPGGAQIVDLGEIASNCSLVSSGTYAFSVSVGGPTRDTARASFRLTCSRTEKFAFRRINQGNAGAPQAVSVSYANGTEVVQVVGGFAPAWSPNGNSLAFGWLDCGYYYYYGCTKQGLAAMNSETGTFIVLTRDTTDSDPAWRPTDGAVIAFGRGGKLYFVDATVPTGSVTQLATPQSVLKASQPSWSPDALKLAFACEMDDGKSDICVINADGTSFARLTNDSPGDANPEWSPDGTQIAFSTSDAVGGSQIMLIGSVGGAITDLHTAGRNPSWTPDGTKILFEGPLATQGISIIALASGAVTRLTTGDDHDPAWRP